MSNAPSKPVSFSRPKVGYFSNRPRISLPEKLLYIYPGESRAFFLLIAHRLQPRSPPHPFILDPSVNQMRPLTPGGAPVPLVQSSLVNIVTLYLGSRLNAGLITSTPMLKMGSDCWSSIKILLCPLLGFRYDQHPRLQRRCAAYLVSLCTNNSSGGRQISASMARVEIVRIAPVIPKQANLWILLSFFLALAV